MDLGGKGNKVKEALDLADMTLDEMRVLMEEKPETFTEMLLRQAEAMDRLSRQMDRDLGRERASLQALKDFYHRDRCSCPDCP